MTVRSLLAVLLTVCLACLPGLAGCSWGLGGAGERRGGVEDGRIELPESEPVPGLASGEWAPPPVWLVSGGRVAQGSYGEFCKLDDCTGMETPEQMGEDLASMRASGKAFVVVGSDRVSGFAAGTQGWGETESPVPGVYTEPGVPPDLRRLEARRVPEGAGLTVEPAPGETTDPASASASGGASVFGLSSTGGPGDRRLSVFLRIGEYDRAVYHWRLDPGQTPEVTSSEASPETLEELPSGETTTLAIEGGPNVPAFRNVVKRSVGDSPTSASRPQRTISGCWTARAPEPLY